MIMIHTLTSGTMSSTGEGVGYSVGLFVTGACVGLSVGSSVTGAGVGSGNFASSISVGFGVTYEVGAEDPQLSITGVDVSFFVGFFEGFKVG